MANERITEDIVREHFKGDPLFKSVRMEEQRSSITQIKDLLKNSSKTGKKKPGYPEFIISFPSDNEYVIVVECKASETKHESKNRDCPSDFAVDGVLHYAKALSQDYNVIAIAVSGENNPPVVSHFLWTRKATSAKELKDKSLLTLHSYIHLFKNEQFAENLKNIDIVQKAIDLNELYNDYSFSEESRNTLVSAILLSLMDTSFRKGYGSQISTKSLGDSMINAIEATINVKKVRNSKAMVDEFKTIMNSPIFIQEKIKNKRNKKEFKTLEILKQFITYLEKYVYPLIAMEDSGIDVLGKFYTEFIRYAGSQQKQGLVLTPFHITNFFCDLAELTPNDIVYDPCCGTAGFLVAAKKRMCQLAGNDEELKKKIREERLIGVEMRPSMYTYACTNMILRGEGQANIYCGDCFQTKKDVCTHKPTVAFLNPPYDVGNAEQMHFIRHALEVVEPQNGRVVAIVQMSCGIKEEKELLAEKKSLLAKHTLEAVISMPDDLFYPVGVVTCIMVWHAGVPNKGKTWFGYYKDDGFIKRKHQGRIDAYGRFKNVIYQTWKALFADRDEMDGLCVKKEVKSGDEWCAEAYLQTNYGSLTDEIFVDKIKNYIACGIIHDFPRAESEDLSAPLSIHINLSDTDKWKEFRYDKIFKICKGFYNKKPDDETGKEIPFIGATDNNNGITHYYSKRDIEISSKTGKEPNHALSKKLFQDCCITVSNNGSVGYAFYQPKVFTCTHDVNPLYLKDYHLNVYIALFLCTIIELEQFRWAYGRKWRPKRMPSSIIKLPVTNSGEPDWDYMERYIKGLPFSSSLL